MPDRPLSPSQLAEVRAAVDVLLAEGGSASSQEGASVAFLVALDTVLNAAASLLAMAEAAEELPGMYGTNCGHCGRDLRTPWSTGDRKAHDGR